jgi:Tryptophan-associated transmembrane protein (Trp_oprn_chp)
MATLGFLRLRPSADAVRTQVRTVSLSDQFSLAATPWPWLYGVAGLLVTLAAATTLASAGHWPQRLDRFRRDPDDNGTRRLLDDPADAWRALDAGLDPTADLPEVGAGPKHPDVHSSATSDTMGSAQPSSKADPSAE